MYTIKQAAARSGVLYLGANVPLANWLTAVEKSLAPVVVVGVVATTDRAAAAEVVATLRTALRPPVAMLGGGRAHEVGGPEGSIVLPSSIDDAVTAVLGLIAPAD